jgi:hypothetical protein
MKTRITISSLCVLLAAAHIIWPDIKVDMTTIILIVAAVLPWLASVIRSVELPGGFKIELQDIKIAAGKVTAGKMAKTTSQLLPNRRDDNLEFLRDVSKTDPNLAFVGLRIEIERRLSQIVRDLELPATRRSAGALLRDLVAHECIDRETAAGLGDLIALGNQAAHGVEVSSNAAQWAIDTAPLILDLLDSLVLSGQNRKMDG